MDLHSIVLIEASVLLLIVLANMVISFHCYNQILDQLKVIRDSQSSKNNSDRSNSISDTHKQIDELLSEWNRDSKDNDNQLEEGTYCSITDQYKDSILFRSDENDDNQ